MFHATRKTFSNVKTTISEEWRGSCDINNNTCHQLKPDKIWNDHKFFDDQAGAKLFLGELDAIFLAAYSIV
jgi:MFS transporter, OPA family, solute carrier family 37 (glycerol-3-phosphate transporter), member 3